MSSIILRLDSGIEIIIDPYEQTIDVTNDKGDEYKVAIAFCEWNEIDEFVRNQIIAKKTIACGMKIFELVEVEKA